MYDGWTIARLGLEPARWAATAYLAACLAGEYHGQIVDGYAVLERAG